MNSQGDLSVFQLSISQFRDIHIKMKWQITVSKMKNCGKN